MQIIYAVEDEQNIRELYSCALDKYKTYTFETAEEMFDKLKQNIPDLFLLDLMLPDMSGAEIVEILKSDVRYRNIPIIVVSAKNDEVSKVNLLNIGADDYLSKPFGVMELNARINANLRKSNLDIVSLGNIKINNNEHSVKINNTNIDLTLKEYQLLSYLINNARKVCSREDLLNNVWGINFEGETRTLDMHIKMIRDKLLNSDIKIITVRGVGYKLTEKDI